VNTFGVVFTFIWFALLCIAVSSFALLIWFTGVAIMEIPKEIKRLREVIEKQVEVKGDGHE